MQWGVLLREWRKATTTTMTATRRAKKKENRSSSFSFFFSQRVCRSRLSLSLSSFPCFWSLSKHVYKQMLPFTSCYFGKYTWELYFIHGCWFEKEKRRQRRRGKRRENWRLTLQVRITMLFSFFPPNRIYVVGTRARARSLSIKRRNKIMCYSSFFPLLTVMDIWRLTSCFDIFSKITLAE